MKPEEKRLLMRYAGLDGLPEDELDQFSVAANEAMANAARLPSLRREIEPAHILVLRPAVPNSDTDVN
jgi:hypothetical protein